MTFRGNDGKCVGIEESPGRCKPNYEEQATRLKKRLDATEALDNALADFSDKNGTYNFQDISSFAEMVGGVVIIKREQTAEYASLLKLIEEEA